MELGRYYTGPSGSSMDPSRTSVNLSGDVAVSNRGFGSSPDASFTKVIGLLSNCPDVDGDGTVRTSTGAEDILPWGEDECVHWNHPATIDGGSTPFGPRAIAWDPGSITDDGVVVRAPSVWVGYKRDDVTVFFERLDTDTGERLASTEVVDTDTASGFAHHFGPYGGASDANGNFWAMGVRGQLVVIDRETTTATIYDRPNTVGYGFALDENGEPWIGTTGGSLYHLDPASGTYTHYSPPTHAGYSRGLAIDRDGIAWQATHRSGGAAPGEPCGVLKFDTHEREFVGTSWVPIEDCAEPVGVSIDFDDYVWVVDRIQELASKIDPDTHEVVLKTGNLVSPYTYSDMTGAGIGLVVNPPVE
ncbi:MAG: hypothetical protein B7733_24825 [Myxococcales bacterium FL481]|nr:MAG: hypothetical protein B7733_24825 [Myxococcales bacterium FL481]